MNIPNDTRLKYDSGSYQEELKRSIFPGIYQLNSPYNDCNDCGVIIPDDPFIRYQNYGQNTCSMKKAVDDSSELLGLNYKKSKCNANEYLPGRYESTGCNIKGADKPRSCIVPREDTRLSNPPCTLKETGINRWEWLCFDPQERAIEAFDRVPVNYRMVAKDNHIPCIETPEDQSVFFPKDNSSKLINNLDEWKNKSSANISYSPGYPYGSMYPSVKCKN
jgi:hypothetical protein